MKGDNTGPNSHHVFGPSALKWVEICPGYRSDGGTNAAAEEGTKLHEACETEEFEGLDEEQMRMVAKCLDYLAPFEKGADEVIREICLNITLHDEADDTDPNQ